MRIREKHERRFKHEGEASVFLKEQGFTLYPSIRRVPARGVTEDEQEALDWVRSRIYEEPNWGHPDFDTDKDREYSEEY